jgi:hypothetical protein
MTSENEISDAGDCGAGDRKTLPVTKSTNNRKRQQPNSTARAAAYVYDGRQLVAVLKPSGRRKTKAVAVVGNRRKSLGVFRSRAAALSAFNSWVRSRP